MAAGNWAIFASIRFASNGAAVMGGLSRQSTMLNASLARQQGQISKNEAAMIRYRARLDEVHQAQRRFGTTVAAGGAALGLGAIGFAVNEAAKLERAMTGVQIATGATGNKFKMLRDMVIDVSGKTAQSASTIAQEMQTAATVAFKRPQDLKAVFPMMAKFADVRFMASGGKEDPVETVAKSAQFAHYFAAYGPQSMQRMLDFTAKLMMTTHATLGQMVTQGKQFIPAMVRTGVPMETIMQYLAIMGQTGYLSGFGGSSLNQVLRYSLGAASLTAHASKARAKGIRELGLKDSAGHFKFVDKDGNFQLDALVQYLQQKRDAMKKSDPRFGNATWFTEVGDVYGVTGQRILQTLADKITRAQIRRNEEAFARIPGVQKQWESYTHDFFYQWNAFTTNLRNIAAALALPSLPALTRFFTDLNAGITSLVNTILANPDMAKTIGRVFVGLTAVFAARAVVGVLGMTAAMWKFNESVTALSLNLSRGTLTTAAGGGAAAAAANAGRIGGLWGFLDNFLFFGLGGFVGKLGSRLLGVMNGRFYLPLLGFITRLGPLGARLAGYALSIAAGFGTIEGAILSFLGFLVSGPVLAGLAFAGSIVALNQSAAGSDEAKPLMGRSRAFWLDYEKKHGPKAVPTSVEAALHSRPSKSATSGSKGGSVTNNVTVHVYAPGAKKADADHVGNMAGKKVSEALRSIQRTSRQSGVVAMGSPLTPRHLLAGVGTTG